MQDLFRFVHVMFIYRPVIACQRINPTRKQAGRLWLATAAAALLSGCVVGSPDGIPAVEGFEVDRYLGRWYEIARLDHSFERGLSHVTAEYSLREDGGLKVVNRGYDEDAGEWSEATGKAYFVEQPSLGRLKVSFFGPFYGGYNIMALDQEEYRWALIGGNDTDYLWVLSRSPSLDPAVYQDLLSRAEAVGFPVEELILVEQGQRQQALLDREGP